MSLVLRTCPAHPAVLLNVERNRTVIIRIDNASVTHRWVGFAHERSGRGGSPIPTSDPDHKLPVPVLLKYGAPSLVLITTAAVLAIAWWLWTFGGERGQGAAFALAGGAATHLLKEATYILRSWLDYKQQ